MRKSLMIGLAGGLLLGATSLMAQGTMGTTTNDPAAANTQATQGNTGYDNTGATGTNADYGRTGYTGERG